VVHNAVKAYIHVHMLHNNHVTKMYGKGRPKLMNHASVLTHISSSFNNGIHKGYKQL